MVFKNKKIHFIGICGISLSALAILSVSKGAIVSGSDICCGAEYNNLIKNGINVYLKHAKKHVKNKDIVVFSSAISEDNPELIEAKKLGIKILTRAELLYEISKHYKNVIAIAGSHGKTTVTAMISKILLDAKLDPTIHIGGHFGEINSNVRVGTLDYFITEACEYKNNFLKLKPTISVILNVEADHLDYFKTFNNVKSGFFKFASCTTKSGFIVYNADDSNIMLPQNIKTIGFSCCNKGCISAVNIKLNKLGAYAFDVMMDGFIIGNINLSVCGKHNIKNALASVLVALELGISFNDIKNSLGAFYGVDRRFQVVGKINGATIINDYAHHPTEILQSINTAKTFTKGSVVAIFQPHTYTRTQSLFEEFAQSLMLADCCAVYKIYAAREVEIDGVNHITLCQKIKENNINCMAINNKRELKNFILNNAQNNNTILLLGAGDFQTILNEIKFE